VRTTGQKIYSSLTSVDVECYLTGHFSELGDKKTSTQDPYSLGKLPNTKITY
jgi:hypothetical protein